MILIDNALKKREQNNNPIKVAIIGAGEMAKGIINQITKYSPGIVIAVTYNRTIEKAVNAYKAVGIREYNIVDTTSDLEKSIKNGIVAITQNIDAICEANGIDVIVEVTGTIEFAASTIIKAFDNGKNVLSFNVEIDATLGPILKCCL